MSVLGGVNEGDTAFVMKCKWWRGLSLQGGRIVFMARKYSQAASEEAGGQQPTSRSLSPGDGDIVRHHAKQGVVSLAEQRCGSEPRMSCLS